MQNFSLFRYELFTQHRNILLDLQIGRDYLHLQTIWAGFYATLYRTSKFIINGTFRKEMKCSAGILRYGTDWFTILHKLVHAFLIFVLYHELIRVVQYHELFLVVSRNPRCNSCSLPRPSRSGWAGLASSSSSPAAGSSPWGPHSSSPNIPGWVFGTNKIKDENNILCWKNAIILDGKFVRKTRFFNKKLL